AALTLGLSGAPAAAEGGPYALGLSPTCPTRRTSDLWVISWGDGSVEAVPGGPASARHAYADGPAGYTISATATAAGGSYAAGNTVAVTVLNVAPTLALSGAAFAAPGSAYTVSLSASD